MLSTVDINTESESVLISSSDHRWGLEFDTSHVNEEHQRALATALRHKCWTRNHAEPPLPPQQQQQPYNRELSTFSTSVMDAEHQSATKTKQNKQTNPPNKQQQHKPLLIIERCEFSISVVNAEQYN